jgi:hypothetical protein
MALGIGSGPLLLDPIGKRIALRGQDRLRTDA